MSTSKNSNEEEVDLGSLFVIIGKAFSSFFNFIGSIFKSIFHFVITILVFFKENFIKIVIAAVLGGVLGGALEVNKTDTYKSELLLEPNFKSARQLYENINYYNNLVKQKDTVNLIKTFKLDNESAKSIRKFDINPVMVENDIINAYNKFILEVDTATVRSYSFDDFKESFTFYDYKLHKVTVVATNNIVFNKLGNPIISSIVENKYFNRIKELSNKNLNRTDSLYRQNLTQIDSLRKVYMEVMVAEAKKQTTGTNIDLGGQKRTTKELELFETNRQINLNLKDIASEKSTKYEVINVISNFQPVGTKIEGVMNNYVFMLGMVFASLMIVFLLLLKLNKYLGSYKKQ